LVSREAFETIDGFDERLSGYEDDDLFLRMFRAGYATIYVNKPLSQWRIYPSSSSYTYRMARSRMIYAAKLFENYPDQVEMNRYFARDLIAPRFMATVLGDFNNALKRHDRSLYKASISDLNFLVKHLRLRERIRWTLLLAVVSSYPIGRALQQLAWSWSIMRAGLRAAVRPLRSFSVGLFRI
jgi:GT2 family glycosyltransferase